MSYIQKPRTIRVKSIVLINVSLVEVNQANISLVDFENDKISSSLKSNSSSKVFLGFSLLRLKQKSLKTLFLAIFSLFHIWPKKVLKLLFLFGEGVGLSNFWGKTKDIKMNGEFDKVYAPDKCRLHFGTVICYASCTLFLKWISIKLN